MKNCKICCLYSGSHGNCAYISAGGANILIDAGKSARALCSALSKANIDISSIDAIFITHDHRDHTLALQTLSHKHQIPIHMLLTSAEAFRGLDDERLFNCFYLYPGKQFEAHVKGLKIKAFPTMHDSMASVGYRLTFTGDDGKEYSIGYATDLGVVTDEVKDGLCGCFAAVVESNHDEDMLIKGPYPIEVKKRIHSRLGHLSNVQSAELIALMHKSGTRHVMLAHLSEENNTEELALCEVRSVIADEGFNLKAARQDEAVWLIGGECDCDGVGR